MLTLNGCNPTPQVVALVLDELESLTAETVLEEADDNAGADEELEETGALVMALLCWLPELVPAPLAEAPPLDKAVPLDVAEPLV